jgi:hypothetical protein
MEVELAVLLMALAPKEMVQVGVLVEAEREEVTLEEQVFLDKVMLEVLVLLLVALEAEVRAPLVLLQPQTLNLVVQVVMV